MYFFLHKPVIKIVANFASDMAHSALEIEKIVKHKFMHDLLQRIWIFYYHLFLLHSSNGENRMSFNPGCMH